MNGTTVEKGLGVVKGSVYMLGGAMLATALRYAFQIAAARWLGSADYGVISNLFSWVLTLVGFLSSGTAVTITRRVAQREAQGKDSSSVLQGGLVVESVLLGIMLIAGIIFRSALAEHVFHGSRILLFIMIGAVIGQGSLVVLQGVIKGFRRFRYSAILTFALPAIRLGLAGVLVAVLAYGSSGAALAILLAPMPVLVLAIYWTWCAAKEDPGRRDEPMPVGTFIAFALPATIMTGIERFMPRSGTILLNLFSAENADEIVGLFTAAITLARAPEVLLEALSGPLLSNFSRADAMGDAALLKRYATRTAEAMALLPIVYVLAMPLLAPKLIPFIYGKEFSFPRFDVFLLSIGTGFYFAAKLMRQIVLVNRGAGYVARTWAYGTGLLIVLTIVLPLPLLRRVETSYILANGLVAGLLTYQVIRATRAPRRQQAPEREQTPIPPGG